MLQEESSSSCELWVPMSLCAESKWKAMEFFPHNYRIFILVNEWELPISEEIGDVELQLVFKDHCATLKNHIKRVVGGEILEPEAKRLIYPSHLLSIFISNLMDLLQDVKLVESVTNKVVNEEYLQNDVLYKSYQRYDLWKGHGYVGGLFPKHFLLH